MQLRAHVVQPNGLTVAIDEQGVIRIYVNEHRFTWKVVKPGANIEVIVFEPVKRRTKPIGE